MEEDAQNVLFCSVHLFEVGKYDSKFYPGTGDLKGKNLSNNSMIM